MLVVLAVPASAGPFPDTAPLSDTADGLAKSGEALAGATTNFTSTTFGAASDFLIELQKDPSTVPMDPLNATVIAAGTLGTAFVKEAHDVFNVTWDGAEAHTHVAQDYGAFLSMVAQNKLNIQLGGDQPVQYGVAEPCADDPQAALDAALPGSEILVCAGSYGPLTVRTPFVTLRAEQGPAATSIDGDGGDAVRIEASGVSVIGFRIHGATAPGAAGIRIGAQGDGLAGEVWATVLRGNQIVGNAIGVDVQMAEGTLITDNTIRASTLRGGAEGVGIRAAPVDAAGLGTLSLANNLLLNARHALVAPGGALVSALDHFGGLAPTLELAPGICVSADDPTSGLCRNAVGTGVAVLGWSPAPH